MRNSIKQQYTPYWDWEDWKAGMWERHGDERLQECIAFTGDHERYGSAMMEVIEKWPNTMLNNLTNQSINRRAFVGHCAVSYKLGISENVTRKAWKFLTESQRSKANYEAEKAIKKWELNQRLSRTLKHGSKDVIGPGYQTRLQLR